MSTYGYVGKFGRTPDIDNLATNEEVWDGTGAYTFLTVATELTVSSSSALDITTGTGARSVTVFYLDANWREQSAVVPLNGQNASATTITCIRVYRAYITTVGTGGVNAGDIWIGSGALTNGVPANKNAGILTGLGQTLMAIYSVPAQAVGGAKVVKWYATCGAAQAAYATVALQTREFGEGWRTRRVLNIGEGGKGGEEFPEGLTPTVSAKADIRIRVLTNGVINTSIAAGFDLELLDA